MVVFLILTFYFLQPQNFVQGNVTTIKEDFSFVDIVIRYKLKVHKFYYVYFYCYYGFLLCQDQDMPFICAVNVDMKIT